MNEQAIDVPTSDGISDSYLYTQDSGEPAPGVLLYTDIFGIRDANRGMAARLCTNGFTVLMPNVFYRIGTPPIIDRSAPDSEVKSKFSAIRESLTNDALHADAASYVDFLVSLDQVASGPIGAVGYCFTGKLALFTAAERPERVASAASFHGGGLYTDGPESPHFALPSVKAELYFGHAFEDRSMPAESIEKLDAALDEWGGESESEVYEGAGHGWTVPDSQSYEKEAAERAHEKLVALFRKTLC